MNELEKMVLAAHRESLAIVGEILIFRGVEFPAVFSEIETETAPDVAGFSESATATATTETEEIQKAAAGAPIEGGRITRKKTGKIYRVASLVDNGGGITDLEMQSLTE